MFIIKVLVEHSLIHSFMLSVSCPRAKLNSSYRDCMAAKPKVFTIWPLTEKVCKLLL